MYTEVTGSLYLLKSTREQVSPARSHNHLLALAALLTSLIGLSSPGTALAQTNSRADKAAPELLKEVETDSYEPSSISQSNLEEIVVTGQAAQVMQNDDLNSSIGFDAMQIQAEGIDNIRDLSNFTPNLEIKSAFASVNPTIFLRGVGLDDFNANSASAVSIYQDGYYMNSPAGQLFGFFDVASAEVLLGPQPTLTNASAGAILIRSRKPTQTFESYMISTFGNYGLKQFEGAINVPIISDRLSARIAFKTQRRDGVTENMCPGVVANTASIENLRDRNSARGECRFTAPQDLLPNPRPPVVGPSDPYADWVNDRDNWAARAMISYLMPLPSGQSLDWMLIVNGGQNKSLATQYQHTGMTGYRTETGDGEEPDDVTFYDVSRDGQPAKDVYRYTQDFSAGNNFAGEYDRVGPELLDLLGGSVKTTWEATDTVTVENRAGYFWHDRKTYANDDAGPKNGNNNDYTDTAWQFSEEFTVNWTGWDDDSAEVGVFYMHEDLNAYNFFRDYRNFVVPNAFEQTYRQTTSQWGIYAKGHYNFPSIAGWGSFIENFSLDGSVRYNEVEKHMVNLTSFSRLVAGADEGPNTSIDSNIGDEVGRWTGWAGDLSLTYQFTEEVSAYFKYSHGWKPGHFNANTLRSTQPVSAVKPENLDALEIALRGTWFENRLSTNISAFRYKYNNLQVFQVTVDAANFILRRLINSKVANIYGVEWNILAEPIENLMIEFTGGYLWSEYTDFKAEFERNRYIVGEGLRVTKVSVSYSGNRLIASPEWSLTGNIQYSFLTRYGDIIPRLSFSYRDNVFFDANEGCGAEGNVPQCLLQQPSVTLLNATVRYVLPGGRIEVMGFVRNLTNEEYKIQSFDLTRGSGMLLHVFGDPRTYGAAINIQFN